MFCLSPDPPLLPRTRTGGHLLAFWVNSSVFQRVSRPATVRVCLGAVCGGAGSGGAGPGSPLTARLYGCALRPGAPLAPAVPLRTPRAARRAAFTHSGHFEFIFCPVDRSYLHRFGLLEGFSCSLYRFLLYYLCGWHFYFKVTLLSPASVQGGAPSSSVD